MKQRTYRGEWVGCSDLTERRKELLKAHEEFEEMIANGFEISKVELKPKRKRFKSTREPRKVVVSIMNGFLTITVDFAEWKQRGSIGRVIKEIY